MTRPRIRIDLPNSPEKIIKLAQELVANHTELGGASPLAALNWAEIQPEIRKAFLAHKEAKKF